MEINQRRNLLHNINWQSQSRVLHKSTHYSDDRKIFEVLYMELGSYQL